jgi:hypothetical protein
LRWNFTVTPDGMVTLVKLNIPEAGRGTVVLTVGANAPSTPVLPLVAADAPNGVQLAPTAIAIAIALALVLMALLLLVIAVLKRDRLLMGVASIRAGP